MGRTRFHIWPAAPMAQPTGVPFEERDTRDASLGYGGRQFFYPDAARIFEEIDRSIAGRAKDGSGSPLSKRADYEFFRVLPPGGFTRDGEVSGQDFFPYMPYPIAHRPRYKDLAVAINMVRTVLSTGKFAGGIWLEASPTLEETLYWLNLLIDTDVPIVGLRLATAPWRTRQRWGPQHRRCSRVHPQRRAPRSGCHAG